MSLDQPGADHSGGDSEPTVAAENDRVEASRIEELSAAESEENLPSDSGGSGRGLPDEDVTDGEHGQPIEPPD